MSDVEQQRFRSAVDLQKSSTKCRRTNTTDVDSPSSDNVLSSFQKRTGAETFAVASSFQIVRAKLYSRIQTTRASGIVDYSYASIRNAGSRRLAVNWVRVNIQGGCIIE